MLTALNEQKNICYASNILKKQGDFYCPGCQRKVFLKKGKKTIAHFAHYQQDACYFFSENESKEHLNNKLWLCKQIKNCTLEAYLPSLKQRPDLLSEKTVIEIQCSSLSLSRLLERVKQYQIYHYLQWWLLGKKLQPQKYQKLTQLQKAFCGFHQTKGFYLWGIDSLSQEILLFHHIQWHYQFGSYFEIIKYEEKIVTIELLNKHTALTAKPLDWSISGFKKVLLKKLNRCQPNILFLQELLYIDGQHLMQLSKWCYYHSVFFLLFEESLLIIRYFFERSSTFAEWLVLLKKLKITWCYPFIFQKEILRLVYQECQQLTFFMRKL